VDVPAELLDAIRDFPREREVEHCGVNWTVSPFDLYAPCPRRGNRLKLRAFSAVPDFEDVFDAVFEWMTQPRVDDLVRRRQEAIAADSEG
jgi:hypothetical protein